MKLIWMALDLVALGVAVIGWELWAGRSSRMCCCGHTRGQHLSGLMLMGQPCMLCLGCVAFMPVRRWGR